VASWPVEDALGNLTAGAMEISDAEDVVVAFYHAH